MRKDSRNNNNVTVSTVQGYHNNNWGGESYAFDGFQSNKYFTSDRFVKLTSDFRREDGQPLQGFGLEIETECWGIKAEPVYADVLKKIVFPLFPADLFKMQHDGSLGHDYDPYYGDDEPDNACLGIECITQIMTKAFIRNNYRNFKAMYNTYFRAFDVSCSRSTRCGMHVNISNAVFGNTQAKQIEAIRKLHYFINSNFKFACKLFKRDYQNTEYCGVMSHGADKEYCKRMTIGGGDHYHCMNYSHFHAGRIELRLVGGQEDYYHFRNTMETVFFLCERMKKISWEDLDDMTKVFKGCNQYVYKRLSDTGLDTPKLAVIQNNVKEENLELMP